MADVTLSNAPGRDAYQVPKNIEKGVNSVSRVWTANGLTISASHVLPMIQVPHGAVIQSIVGHGFIGAASAIVNVGIQGLSDDFLISDTTLSSGGNVNFTPTAGNLPYRVSLSDDSVTRYVMVQAKFKTVPSATVTGRIALTVLYSMDQDSKISF